MTQYSRRAEIGDLLNKFLQRQQEKERERVCVFTELSTWKFE